MRILLPALSMALTGWLCTACNAQAQDPSSFAYTFSGRLVIDERTTLEFNPENPIGGLSGIEYLPALDKYALISDKYPSRYYILRIIQEDSLKAVIEDVIQFNIVDGATLRKQDPESIRLRQQDKDATFIWTNEGNSNLMESSLFGDILKEYPLPDRYRFHQGENYGIQNNKSLESLALTPNGHIGYIGTENALKHDLPCARRFREGQEVVRIAEYDLQREQIRRELIYPVALGSGLVELLYVDSTRLYALERNYFPLKGNSIRIYEVDLEGKTDVSNYDSLCDIPNPKSIKSAKGALVFSFDPLKKSGVLPRIDNVEGMTFGAPTPEGKRTIVLISDNNFNERQTTHLLMLTEKR